MSALVYHNLLRMNRGIFAKCENFSDDRGDNAKEGSSSICAERIAYKGRMVTLMSLSELKQKDVINTRTGQSLGKPMDLEFCAVDGRITALVVPGEFSLMHMIRGEKCGVVIPWESICKIGDDVILVDIDL